MALWCADSGLMRPHHNRRLASNGFGQKKRTHNEHGPRHVTPAGRSVFYDLGFDEAEARVLAMRADLMAALREHIEKTGWTQSEAAKKLGITQPRISALMKGAWRDFSAGMLLVLGARLGLRPILKLAA
ncbi:MAG: transcriptional regulator, family [Gammaproteobacteria bacterium]|nr:transcriptional regulator, family [Gammaproteobacteria bacterium]